MEQIQENIKENNNKLLLAIKEAIDSEMNEKGLKVIDFFALKGSPMSKTAYYNLGYILKGTIKDYSAKVSFAKVLELCNRYDIKIIMSAEGIGEVRF